MTFHRLLPRTRFSVVAVVLAGAVLAGSAGVARAAPSVCRYVPAAAGGTGDYECGLDGCSEASECSMVQYGDAPICDLWAPGSDSPHCRRLCGTMFGCGELSECPVLFGQTPSACTPITVRAAGADGPPGFCTYTALAIDYCVNAVSPSVIAHFYNQCHTTPDGTPTSNYMLGDCDADGCPNGLDAFTCDATTDEACGSVMRGPTTCSAINPLDGGIAVFDAGPLPVVDGGNVPDASTADGDGGNAQDDAATSAPDAGAFDAGANGEVDAGVAVSFNGGGGCRCAVPGGGARSTSAGMMIAGLALAALIRRRRRE